MTDPLIAKILETLDTQMYGKKSIDKSKVVYMAQQMEKGIDNFEEKYRDRGIRKDGRSRTHKKRVPLTLGKGPSKKVVKERAERDAKRLYFAWYLWNY